MRDRALGSTITLYFNTSNPDAGGAPVAPSSAFVAADFEIYKGTSSTPKSTTNGITVTSPVNGRVGRHRIDINTGNSTGDTGFWESGTPYFVSLNTAKTVAGYSVMGLSAGEFSLELQTADVRKFGGTAGTFSAGVPTAALSPATETKIDQTLAYVQGLNDQTGVAY
jgi:hypothetical protein